MFLACSPKNSKMCSTLASYGSPRNLIQSLRVPDVMICCGSKGRVCNNGGGGGGGSYTLGSLDRFKTCQHKVLSNYLFSKAMNNIICTVSVHLKQKL